MNNNEIELVEPINSQSFLDYEAAYESCCEQFCRSNGLFFPVGNSWADSVNHAMLTALMIPETALLGETQAPRFCC